MTTSDGLGLLSSWVTSSTIQVRPGYSSVRKQTSETSSNVSPILSTGAIIGIAVAGAAALFIGLIIMVMHFARARHQSKSKPRKVDLEEDEIDPEVQARLKKIAASKYEPYAARSTPNSGILVGKRTRSQRNAKQQLVVPPNDFQITGLRDSWPLVSLFPASGIDLSNATAISNSDDYLRAVPGSAMNPYQLWQQSAQSQPIKPDTIRTRHRSRSNTSVQPPVPSLITSPLRSRSMSDNQLTSILRSTSQRLRDAQKGPVSRTLSVLSQVSGNPPLDKAPSPPEGQNGTSREDLVREYDGAEVESAKSSLLEMFRGTPSPTKVISWSASSGWEKSNTPPLSELYDIGNLAGDTTDLAVVDALNSPKKQSVRTEQDEKLQTTSEEVITVHEDHREDQGISEASDRGRVGFPPRKSSLQLAAYNAFRTTSDVTELPEPIQSQNEKPVLERQTTFGQEIENEATGKQPRVTLGHVSGNSISIPNESGLDEEGLTETGGGPFQWYKDAAKELHLKHGARRSSSRQGHKRSKVTRMSGHYHHGSVSVVHEEFEPVPPTIHAEERSITPNIQEENNGNGSPTSVYESRVVSSRPPSVATFGSFAPSSPSKSPRLIERPPANDHSRSSYSATLSMYNLYTSNDEDMPATLAEYENEIGQSKKSRRHAQHFSVLEPTREELSSPAADRTLSQYTNFSRLSGDLQRASLPPLSSSSDPNFSFVTSTYPILPENSECVVKGLNIKPATANSRLSQLYGPRSLPSPVIRDSVQHSIGLLRRMNSQVSNCSTADSEGSPTLPAYRGGGISPTKHYRRGNSNYLSMGHSGLGMKTMGPAMNRRGRRLRQVGEEHEVRERDRAYDRYRDKIRDSLVDKNDEVLSQIEESVNSLTSANDKEHMISPGLSIPFIGQSYMDSPTYKFQDKTQSARRWSEVMSPPMNKSVRHESQIQMPSPRSPPKMKAWQSRMAAQGEESQSRTAAQGDELNVTQEISELYDENGFLRSSPERRDVEMGRGSGGMI